MSKTNQFTVLCGRCSLYNLIPCTNDNVLENYISQSVKQKVPSSTEQCMHVRMYVRACINLDNLHSSFAENVAYLKSATQSSLRSPAYAKLAVDGVTKTSFCTGETNNCAHTKVGISAKAWWRVDLGQPYAISKIKIYNRDVLG